jgi:beta-glucosidase-like glycosyl hydrolase
MNRDTYYVDVDGTLLCGSLNTWFVNERARGHLTFDELVATYTKKMSAITRMGKNEDLFRELEDMKRNGARLILWTNRDRGLRNATQSQLGHWWELFDDHLFRSGQKIHDVLDGVVIDDEYRHARCGQLGFRHIVWHCCHDSSCCA